MIKQMGLYCQQMVSLIQRVMRKFLGLLFFSFAVKSFQNEKLSKNSFKNQKQAGIEEEIVINVLLPVVPKHCAPSLVWHLGSEGLCFVPTA